MPYYKIGRTRTSVENRRLELQPGCPWPLDIVAIYPGKDLERRLHRKLATHRMRGEWFHLPDGLSGGIL